MIHDPVPPVADFVVEFPCAAERARLRASTALSPDPGVSEPAGVPAPAAAPLNVTAAGAFSDDLFAAHRVAVADGYSHSDLPAAALDRPALRPAGNRGSGGGTSPSSTERVGRKESPPPSPVPLGVSGPTAAGLASVLDRRARQVAQGYDAAHDRALPPTHLVDEAAKYLGDAHDLIRRKSDPARIRLKLVNAAALALAAIDRHDALHP